MGMSLVKSFFFVFLYLIDRKPYILYKKILRKKRGKCVYMKRGRP
ncbi:hypothetical protein HMPREF3214_00419 [Alloscardovia omnicolens]|nr:hypothetical protein HMPREF3214_00419 [Alloscardovia omnicolens]